MNHQNFGQQRMTRYAGAYFPSDLNALSRSVTQALMRAEAAGQVSDHAPLAILAPHDPFSRSGDLAAVAWQTTSRAAPTRIAILNATNRPAQTLGVSGIVVPAEQRAIGLPGCEIRIDRAACLGLVGKGVAEVGDAAFEEAPGIDAHLPFVRQVHLGTPVVPILIGNTTGSAIAKVIDTLAAMPGDTLFVLSGALAHGAADRAVIPSQSDQIWDQGRMMASYIETGQAIGARPETGMARLVDGFKAADIAAGLRVVRLAQSVVPADADFPATAIGAWAMFGAEGALLNAALRQEMRRTVRKALCAYAEQGVPPAIRTETFPVPLQTAMPGFVSLSINGQSLGCVGALAARGPVIQNLVQHAFSVAFGDLRRGPLSLHDAATADLTLTLPGRMHPQTATGMAMLVGALVPGKTGLFVQSGDRRAVFLPAVWAQYPNPRGFVTALMAKAGLSTATWPDDLVAKVFTVDTICDENADETLPCGMRAKT